MRLLLDTNVLLRIVQRSSVDHLTSKTAVIALVNANIELCVVPQVVYEFWSVATRLVEVNGLGMDIPLAEQSVEELLSDFVLLKDERGIFENWRSLVISYAVRGKLTHDARLVAAMKRHSLTHLLTFNVADFRRFTSINVFSPAEVVTGRLPQ